ncbi:MAG: hypothetical protein LBB45_03880 [Methanobrevibacter sp.]|nr:hypothetical protein [Candidatus Methanovirga basalitermitum]
MYTDKIGDKILDILPYDKKYVILDNHTSDPVFYASAKQVAFENEPLDSISIDQDVFIYDTDIIKKIEQNNVVISHKEPFFEHELYMNINDLVSKKYYIDTLQGNEKKRYVPNLGILKMNDLIGKKVYLNKYWELHDALHKEKKFLETMNKTSQSAITDVNSGKKEFEDLCHKLPVASPELIIEQQTFSQVFKDKAYPLISLPGTDIINNSTYSKSLKRDYGFAHYMATDKFTFMPEILEALKEVDSDLYSKVMKKFKELNFSIEIK